MSVFLKFPPERTVFKSDHFFIVFDGYPTSPGHCLIISNDIKETYFDLSAARDGSPGGWISHHPVQNRHRFGSFLG